MNLVLFGPPGSGKGTQGQLLAARLNYRHVATGTIIRTHIAKNTSFGRAVEQDIARGEFAPTNTMSELIKIELTRCDPEDRWALDGFPRNIEQAYELLEWMKAGAFKQPLLVVSFALSSHAAAIRMAGRKTCAVCGTVYHMTSAPEQEQGYCDRGCGELSHRPEDDPESIVRRINIFETVTSPILAELFRALPVATVDASLGIEPTYDMITAHMRLHRMARL